MMKSYKPIGTHTAHICEATDILYADPPVEIADGKSGDVGYPYGDIKVLCTVGEYLPGTGCAPQTLYPPTPPRPSPMR